MFLVFICIDSMCQTELKTHKPYSPNGYKHFKFFCYCERENLIRQFMVFIQIDIRQSYNRLYLSVKVTHQNLFIQIDVEVQDGIYLNRYGKGNPHELEVYLSKQVWIEATCINRPYLSRQISTTQSRISSIPCGCMVQAFFSFFVTMIEKTTLRMVFIYIDITLSKNWTNKKSNPIDFIYLDR